MTTAFTVNRIHRQVKDDLPLLIFVGALCAALFFISCATSPDAVPKEGKENLSDVEKQWGIKIEGIYITAVGQLVDFRYRVIDPEKATGLMKRKDKALIIDQASGVQMKVPVTKVGQLRGTGTTAKADRVYTVIFTSGGGIIQKGSKVTVVIGEFRAENLVVE